MAAVADAHRREWAFVLAATVRVTSDLDLAEECVQDAYAQALRTWVDRGVPASPGAWLTTVARRRALDVLRRDATLRRALPLLLLERAAGRGDPRRRRTTHPRRSAPAGVHLLPSGARRNEPQLALTLRLLCGLTTAEVARAFLVGESTMAARVTRAKTRSPPPALPTESRRRRNCPPG